MKEGAVGNSSISLVIPVKNEEETLGRVLEAARGYAERIVVIDGRSTDGTRRIAEEAGAEVIPDRGKGKGDAIKLAIERLDSDVLVFMDGDGSHQPADIPRLAAPIERGEAELVIGSRILGGSDEAMITLDHLVRLLGSQLVAFTIAMIFGERITDVENGFRAIKREAFVGLELKADDFTIEQEMVVRALRKGLRVKEIASHEFVRGGGVPKLKTSQGWKFVVKLFQALWF